MVQIIFDVNSSKVVSSWAFHSTENCPKFTMVLDDLRRPLTEKLTEVFGLEAMAISDRDGVILLKVMLDTASVLDKYLTPDFLSSHGNISELSSQLDLGDSEYTVTAYDKLTVVHVHHPTAEVTVSLFSKTEDCVLGQVLDFAKELEPLVADIAKVCFRE